ncbi:hypothetical protein PseudUWO311_01720 [Pseudanabaena sp. UWO311]|uniref:antibiotic biosynthesis monooxygenase n=1 Tax=Pseudanabaena sp. UWO311 TaxID=2487337 RepID=UPI00115C1F1A|nr:antibiotic biosynthesis monooxygenase [Pseudanabaena sp. UWO311]TYQ28889.1 hypothetical protein PseudUWO311_01720 [Pseudanabaena sp. UWO311]
METNDAPVTADVVIKVKPSCEDDFEHTLTKMLTAAEEFPGHLGVNVFRSPDLEYRVVFKYDHLSNFRQWESSEIRKGFLQELKQYTQDEAKYQIITGLETWFTLSSNGAIVPPPRYKMLTITSLAAFPTINLINFLLQPLSWLPPILRTLIAMLALLSAMTYIIMPRMTKLFAKWLYPKRRNG